MRIEVDLSEELVRRLQAEAARRAVTLETLIAEVASELAAEGSRAGRRPAFVAVGASRAGTTDQIQVIMAEGFGRE